MTQQSLILDSKVGLIDRISKKNEFKKIVVLIGVIIKRYKSSKLYVMSLKDLLGVLCDVFSEEYCSLP